MSNVRELVDDAFTNDMETDSVVKPYVISHGTLAVRDIGRSRKFYEEFLGLKCVQHGISSMAVRCGVKFHVICLQMGERALPAHLHNHWGLDVTSEAEVDASYNAVVVAKDRYDLKEITKPMKQHGAYSYYIEDRDSNFWEIQYYEGFQHDDIFDFGDRFTSEGKPVD